MEFREVVTALRAAWWWPVLGLLLGGAAALVISLLQTPQYASTTQLFVTTNEAATPNDALQGGQFSQQRVISYQRLIAGEEMARRVIERLGLDLFPGELAAKVSAEVVPETVLLDVTVTDPSPREAQRIAAAVGEEFTTYVVELEASVGQDTPPVTVKVTEAPELPSEPSSPQTLRNVGLGLLAGLLVGCGAALLWARFDRSVRTAEEAAELASAPVVGRIQRDRTLEDGGQAVDRNGTSRMAEDFRQLRTNLLFLDAEEPPKVVMMTSPVSSEGKTTAVVHLALALVEAGRTVTIVEADLRRPSLARQLGLSGETGLSTVLAGSAGIDDVVQRFGDDHLSVIPGGPPLPRPGGLLTSSQMSTLLDKLRGQQDHVLVDAPPLLPVADATGLAVLVDSVLLSVTYGRTRKSQLRQAAAKLADVGAQVLGVVLTRIPPGADAGTASAYGNSHRWTSRWPSMPRIAPRRKRPAAHE